MWWVSKCMRIWLHACMWTGSFGILRANSHGVPSPTHDSKSQHGGEVPTSKPQETMKIWLIIIKVGYWLIYEKYLRDLHWKVGLIFLLDPTLNPSPKPWPQKMLPCWQPCHIGGFRTWDPVWSGKSQLPSSQLLRLHGLTSSDLELRTWGPWWIGPNSSAHVQRTRMA